jgi:probable rRNA maturation factor
LSSTSPTSRRARAAAAALEAAGVGDGHLSLELVDEERIRELNREHRGRDEPTDVLSFPIDGAGPAPGPRELGDVVICPEHTADLTEARVHGVLHLCGYDHETDDGEMLALQGRVLTAVRGPAPVADVAGPLPLIARPTRSSPATSGSSRRPARSRRSWNPDWAKVALVDALASTPRTCRRATRAGASRLCTATSICSRSATAALLGRGPRGRPRAPLAGDRRGAARRRREWARQRRAPTSSSTARR